MTTTLELLDLNSAEPRRDRWRSVHGARRGTGAVGPGVGRHPAGSPLREHSCRRTATRLQAAQVADAELEVGGGGAGVSSESAMPRSPARLTRSMISNWLAIRSVRLTRDVPGTDKHSVRVYYAWLVNYLLVRHLAEHHPFFHLPSADLRRHPFRS